MCMHVPYTLFFTWEFPFSPPLLPHLPRCPEVSPSKSLGTWELRLLRCDWTESFTLSYLQPPRDPHFNNLQTASRPVHCSNNSQIGSQLDCISLQVNWLTWPRQSANCTPLHWTAYCPTLLCFLTILIFLWSFQETRKGSRLKEEEQLPISHPSSRLPFFPILRSLPPRGRHSHRLLLWPWRHPQMSCLFCHLIDLRPLISGFYLCKCWLLVSEKIWLRFLFVFFFISSTFQVSEVSWNNYQPTDSNTQFIIF